MLDILFRGRDISGQWHYGVPLVFTEDYVCMTQPHTYNKKVESYTLGQYTGLTDKNGNKIFEGDILKSESDGYIGVVKYNEIIACFVSEINDTTPEFYHYSLLNKGDVSKTTQLKETVVIGNIHDNPELLSCSEIPNS